MKTCPDCGERVYNLGCVNCNEPAYIEEQEQLTALYDSKRPRAAMNDVPQAVQAHTRQLISDPPVGQE